MKSLKIIEIDLEFLLMHDLSMEQYLLCYLLYMDEQHKKNKSYCIKIDNKFRRPLSVLIEYNKDDNKFYIDNVEDLVDRGFIKNINKGHKLRPDMLEVTDKFRDVLAEPFSKFEQLYKLYPNFTTINGKKAPLKSCDVDKLRNKYHTIITTKKKHDYVIEITKKAKHKDLLKMSIEKYIASRQWNVIEEQIEDELDVEFKI